MKARDITPATSSIVLVKLSAVKMSGKLPVSKITAHVPALEEVTTVLNDGLSKNFSSVSVNVVDCPDLTQPPFHLSSEGLCGSARLADVGGPPYLLPLVTRDKEGNAKIYNFRTIAEHAELPDALMIGAGAGPAHVVGVNSELMNNVKYTNGKVLNNAYISKVDLDTGDCILEKPNSEDFCLMGNFLISEGKPGKVIEVKASKRSGEQNFVECCKLALRSFYGDKPVALGGVFLVEKGSAHIHIMRDFSKTPLNTQEEVDNWLKFYNMKSILVCVGEMVSFDPGFDLRDEHFHCFSQHGEGGHYHWDTTPEEVEYRAYFTLADYVYRIDQPPKPQK